MGKRGDDVGRDSGRLAPEGVTIAIPNWNHELFLPRSIRSALRAARELRRHEVPVEVLVLDDASRDGSVTLLRQLEALYYEEGLRVLALEQNVGVAAVRNLALRLSPWRYVAFLDADNELVPENLHHFYRGIRQTGAAVVYGNVFSLTGDPQHTSLLSNESAQARMFDGNYIDACVLCDRQQLIDCGAFHTDRNSPIVEDWELWLHLLASGRRMVQVPLAFAMYHQLPLSGVKKFTSQIERSYESVARIFNQSGVRGMWRFNSKHLRYHPDVGWL